jgi:hypothetical protein
MRNPRPVVDCESIPPLITSLSKSCGHAKVKEEELFPGIVTKSPSTRAITVTPSKLSSESTVTALPKALDFASRASASETLGFAVEASAYISVDAEIVLKAKSKLAANL